jgi:ABC-type transport system involved in multi-copper enzyme maturation permease subunit
MRSLIWKEWREQSWKLGFSCVVLGALALIGLHARVMDDASMVMLVYILAVILLPLLTSASLIGGERSEGSLPSLLALPISPLRIFLAKMLVGIVVCAIPVVVAAGVSVGAAGNREMNSVAMLGFYGRGLLVIISLFIWMLALTVRLPTEMRAGLLAMGVLLFWAMATLGLRVAAAPGWLAISPFSFIVTLPSRVPAYYSNGMVLRPPGVVVFRSATMIFILAVQVIISFLLCFWASWRISLTPEE